MNTDDQTIVLDLPVGYEYLTVLGACITATRQRVDGLASLEHMATHLQIAEHEVRANSMQTCLPNHTPGRRQNRARQPAWLGHASNARTSS
jgi:hypothetical protein